MNTPTTIDLIRHGEPVGGSKYRGQTDDPLSENGWAQMRAALAGHQPWEVVVTSPLARCRAFAEELAARLALPLEVDARFMEVCFGEWEGCTAEELLATDSERLARFWSDPMRHAPPGGETLTAFRDRILAAWEDILAHHAGRHVLIVGHAGTIRIAVCHVLDMPLDRLFRIQVPNAGITRIQVDVNGAGVLPRLVFHAGQL